MYAGFWGLAVKPENTYTQTVEIPFRVTNAALGIDIASKDRGSLLVTVDDEKFVLCSLTPGAIEQQPIDITLNQGEQVTFESTGKNEIHLVGNYVDFDDEEDEDEDYDSEDDDMYSDEDLDLDGLDSDEYDIEEIGDEDGIEYARGKIQEILEPNSDESTDGEVEEEVEAPIADKKRKAQDKPAQQKQAQKAVEVAEAQPAQKKQKKKKAKKADQVPAEVPAQAETKQPKVNAKAAKQEQQQQQQQKQKQKEEANKPAKKQLPGGLVVEDKKIGSGAPVKKGQRVGMYYVGKLASNGRQFDSCTKGKPFWFTLGRGEVIKGWDMGVAGMQKGGERRLTIPASLAYGSRGAPPDIPGNSTLVFDVRVAEIK